MVLVPERDRGRSERRRLPSARGRRRVVGLPVVARGDARAGGRRRVPGALPARLCGARASSRGSVRGGPGRGRPGDRTPPPCHLGRAPLGQASRGRECVLHSKRQRAIHGFAAQFGRRRLAGALRLRRRRKGACASPRSLPIQVPGAVSPVPAAALLAALAAVALITDRGWVVAAIAIGLLLLCLRAPRGRRRLYLVGTLGSALSVFLLSPLVSQVGTHVIWDGPKIPVVGYLDVTSEEIAAAGIQALRLAAVGLAFAAYALLLDLDRLLQAAGFARRSVLAAGLATRLVPTLERDAAGFTEALRGRGLEVDGLRGRARLLSPLVAGSLERALNLAEAMEARGFGRVGRTRAPSAPWTRLDRLALVAAVLLVLGAIWL
ncbi:MAG: energy-coupling factor transporter transmembrane protein EcfT [Actinobacteria bacterium]|nr:MAG: energy-coupling factor transporter transmembrane protein EcfT [Actinomycetota bacterium]